MVYIAHCIPDEDKEQGVLEHLVKTAERAASFAECFGAAETGYLSGMLHDIGKYSDKFQCRIRGASVKVDHATAGMLEAIKLGNIPAAFCIAGHHGGLPDGGNKRGALPDDPTFFGRMSRVAGRDIEDYSAFSSEVQISRAELPTALLSDNQSEFFFTRMLYSCLTDADFLDTEAFMSGDMVERQTGESLAVLAEKLDAYTAAWQAPKGKLNRKRCEILDSVREGGKRGRGLFTLTVPTGGGKTVSSMAFALNHALKNSLRRIIYVIPYTSIIEQTQSVFEKIFGEENVVAHFSNVDYRTDENGAISDRRYLAAENWDAPIILTTAVQFFESLYSNRSSRCRKLHNIAGSVMIFDEAQMLPVPYLRPCISAISQLIRHYGCSAVLCTATQPALNRLFEKILPEYPPNELCPDVGGMYAYFRRVCYENAGILTDEQLAGRLSFERQVLCIVNNRKQAQEIFAMLEKDGSYHLSTTMYPTHRRRALEEIRARLHAGLPCRVVSTSLIEAGVDVDFPTVYRSLAGLDSIIQAGGRCNREGKRRPEESTVYIFESERKSPEIIRQNISSTQRVMRDFEDISSPETVRAYFEFLYYTLKDESALDSKDILNEIESGAMPFASVAGRFRIIESTAFTIFVPHDDGAALIERLMRFGISKSLMRKLGQFAIGVYPKHFRELLDSGAAERFSENSAVLRDLSLYDEKTGLAFSVNEGQAVFA